MIHNNENKQATRALPTTGLRRPDEAASLCPWTRLLGGHLKVGDPFKPGWDRLGNGGAAAYD